MSNSIKKFIIGSALFLALASSLYAQKINNNQVLRKLREQYKIGLKEKDGESHKLNNQFYTGLRDHYNKLYPGSIERVKITGNSKNGKNQLSMESNIRGITLKGVANDIEGEDSYLLSANTRGGTFARLNPADMTYVVGQNLKLGENKIGVSYDSNKEEAYFHGNFQPVKNLKLGFNVRGSIDDILESNIALQAQYKPFKFLDLKGSIQDLENPENFQLQTNLKLDNFSAYARYCNNLGKHSTFVRAEYVIKEDKKEILRFKLNAALMQDRNSLALALRLFEHLMLQYSNNAGNKSVSVSLSFQL